MDSMNVGLVFKEQHQAHIHGVRQPVSGQGRQRVAAASAKARVELAE